MNSQFYGACFIYSIGLYNLLRLCVHSIAELPSKSNFKTSFSVSWIEEINCTFLINIRKMWIIHLQIVGTKSSDILKSFDKCFIVDSSFHSTVVFHSTVFVFVFVLSCYSTMLVRFPAPIQVVRIMSKFGLAKLAIILSATSFVKRPNVFTP